MIKKIHETEIETEKEGVHSNQLSNRKDYTSKKAKYRHEFKYEINPFQVMELKSKVRAVMKLDKNSSEHGAYKIQSIYFDNLYDKAVMEKVSGVSKREKFRIRFYNDDLNYIVLEKKMKNNNLCKKIGTRITKEEYKNILNGNISFMLNHKDKLVVELYAKMKHQLLRPKVLVSYDRIAYTYPVGNVRVTFDSNIRTSLFHQTFLEDGWANINTQETPTSTILEVKYDEFLPEVIAGMLQLSGIRQRAYSKYVAARRFG